MCVAAVTEPRRWRMFVGLREPRHGFPWALDASRVGTITPINSGTLPLLRHRALPARCGRDELSSRGRLGAVVPSDPQSRLMQSKAPESAGPRRAQVVR